MKQTNDDVCIPARQNAAEIFYKDIHGTNFKSDAFPIGHILPKLIDPPEGAPSFDLAGNMLAHVLGKEMKPLTEKWEDYGKLLSFPQ